MKNMQKVARRFEKVAAAATAEPDVILKSTQKKRLQTNCVWSKTCIALALAVLVSAPSLVDAKMIDQTNINHPSLNVDSMVLGLSSIIMNSKTANTFISTNIAEPNPGETEYTERVTENSESWDSMRVLTCADVGGYGESPIGNDGC